MFLSESLIEASGHNCYR